MFYYVLSTFWGQENNIKNHYKDSPLQRLPERVASWFFTHMTEENVLFPMHVVSSRNSQYCTAKWNIEREPFSRMHFWIHFGIAIEKRSPKNTCSTKNPKKRLQLIRNAQIPIKNSQICSQKRASGRFSHHLCVLLRFSFCVFFRFGILTISTAEI